VLNDEDFVVEGIENVVVREEREGVVLERW